MKSRFTVYLVCFLLSIGLHSAFALYEVPKKEKPKTDLNQKLKVSLKKFKAPAPVIKPKPKPKPEPKKEKPKKKVKKRKVKPKKKEIKRVKKVEKVIEEPKVVEPVEAVEPKVEEVVPELVEFVAVASEPSIPAEPPFDYDAYMANVVSMIEAGKEYPYMARKKGYEGLVTIAVVIGAEGHLISAEFVKSSGYGLLDRDAMKLVKSVFPVENLSGNEINMEIPVRYQLY